MSVLERVRAQGPIPHGIGTEELAEQRRQLKQALVERLGLKAIAEGITGGSVERTRTELEVACRSILNMQGNGVFPEHHDLLVRQVLDEVCGLGPIQPLMDDEEVTEVMVNGPDALFFERAGRIELSTFAFDSEEQVMTVLDRILAPLGRRIDKGSPLVNARLANGDRVNAVVPPVAPGGPAVTIRKFSGRITSLRRLVELGALPIWYAQLLSCAVRSRQSIAVAGGTGSGKTTLHAGDAREAVSRLILMARFGMNLPSELIEEQIATALDLIVMSCRLPDGCRRIGSMVEVNRDDRGRVTLSTCVSFDSAADAWSLQCLPGFVGTAQELDIVDDGEVASWRSLIC